MGQDAAAGEDLRQAAVLAQVISSPRLLWDVHDALACYYDALEDTRMATHHKEEVKKIMTRTAAGLDEEEQKAGLPLSSRSESSTNEFKENFR